SRTVSLAPAVVVEGPDRDSAHSADDRGSPADNGKLFQSIRTQAVSDVLHEQLHYCFPLKPVVCRVCIASRLSSGKTGREDARRSVVFAPGAGVLSTHRVPFPSL